MRQILLFPICLYFGFTSVSAQLSLTKLWDKTYGGNQNEEARTMLPTDDGGWLLAGISNSGISSEKSQSGRGDWDYWVIKVDSAGNKVWDKTFGGSGEDRLATIIKTNDGGFILAGVSLSGISGDKSEPSRGDKDVWLVKINASGNKIWDKTYGGSANDGMRTIVPTPDGGFLFGGDSGSNPSFEKSAPFLGSYDYWVIKIDSAGNKLWDKTYGGDALETLNSMVAVDDGYILAGFTTTGISGDKTAPSRGAADLWIVKIDFSGNILWQKSYGGNRDDRMFQIIKTANDQVLILSATQSPVSGDKQSESIGDWDYWLFKLDSNGNKLWEQTIGGTGYDYLYHQSLKEDSDQNIFICGYSASNRSGTKSENSKGGNDIWLVKVAADGTIIGDKTIGHTGADVGAQVARTPENDLLVLGYTNSNAGGDKTENSRGGNDFWLLKYKDRPMAMEILPLKLKVKAITAGVALNWETDDPVEPNTRFYIRRSSDTKQWTTIDSVMSKTTRQSFYFEDAHPFAGINYYQVWQSTGDGIEKSNIVVQRIQSATPLTFYPNPVAEAFTIESDDLSENTVVELKVYNTTGSLVFQTQTVSERHQVQFHPEGLAAGMYQAVLRNKDSQRSIPFWKQ